MALYDKDSGLRQAAAKALGTNAPLKAALGDEYKGFRDCASHGLKKMHRPADAH